MGKIRGLELVDGEQGYGGNKGSRIVRWRKGVWGEIRSLALVEGK